MKNKYQFVYWHNWEDWGLYFKWLTMSNTNSSFFMCYIWSFQVGPFEIRRWLPTTRMKERMEDYRKYHDIKGE